MSSLVQCDICGAVQSYKMAVQEHYNDAIKSFDVCLDYYDKLVKKVTKK